MLPHFKLALIFAKIAKEHGPKLMHANNVDLLTRDLSKALVNQKDTLSDPRKGMFMTAYDVLPVIVEVKILAIAVAKKLDIETKNKPMISILEEIIAKSEERNGGKYAKGVQDTLEWTRALFANPEIQDVLNMEMTEIESPKSVKDVFKFFSQLAGRSQDELTRVSEFLKKAKEVQHPPSTPEKKPAPKANGAEPAPKTKGAEPAPKAKKEPPAPKK